MRMAQSAPSPFTDDPVNRLLDDLPDAWAVKRAHETTDRTTRGVRRELVLSHTTGAKLLIVGGTRDGFATYYRSPGEDHFGMLLSSSLWGRPRFRSFQQCVDRGVTVAARYDDCVDV